jgi:hypothetical protein
MKILIYFLLLSVVFTEDIVFYLPYQGEFILTPEKIHIYTSDEVAYEYAEIGAIGKFLKEDGTYEFLLFHRKNDVKY